jgi:hypothetical protein
MSADQPTGVGAAVASIVLSLATVSAFAQVSSADRGARAKSQTAAADRIAQTLASGVWAYVNADGEVVVSGSFTGVPPDSILRSDALARRKAFDFRSDDPVLGCGAPGMPRAFTAGSPMEFEWDGDTLTIRYESMDVVRTVHVDGRAPSPDTPPTPNGYSLGRWRGDAFVIETSRLDERVVDLLGTPKSSAMTLEEVYRVEPVGDEVFLRVDLTMKDPVIFTEPYVWHFDFVLRTDWELLEYACVERPLELTPGVVAD